MRTTRLHVRLRDVVPEVERTVDVPASCTLPEVHDLLQAALGWTGSHLHQFVTADAVYGVPSEDGWNEQLDESGVRLRDLPRSFTYLYDLGDGWAHDVTVLGAGGDTPGCPDGRGTCPPEDCGGPPGYAELRAALADPTHPQHADVRAWAEPTLPDVDVAAHDLLVRQTAGSVPGSVRLLLDLTSGGVRLTPGGRLPRAVVQQVQAERPRWDPSAGPASREDQLFPLVVLHDLLRSVGLLRLTKGVLSPTRAAADDTETVRRLRSAFAPGGFDERLTDLAVAHLAAHGPLEPAELASAVHPHLGHGWVHADGRPLAVSGVRDALHRRASMLQALDLVDTDGHVWSAGPSARTLSPAATALASTWGSSPAAT